ncbi:hypothetical protein NDU88_004212 [Pleurodeles waltl]|uniref:Uncharacterized protein n=1 Tax=Pleurodeles waltl TaxID=8319 RepID=A0AAV7SI99_PLEWA|nr:hypothetical protein NDU88_004212 [Pleurodeles waltl]
MTSTPSSLGGQQQLGLRRLPCPVAQVLPPFVAEDESGDGFVAVVKPVDSEEEEAEEEDVDNRRSLIQQYYR